jgi:hypothetical protein
MNKTFCCDNPSQIKILYLYVHCDITIASLWASIGILYLPMKTNSARLRCHSCTVKRLHHNTNMNIYRNIYQWRPTVLDMKPSHRYKRSVHFKTSSFPCHPSSSQYFQCPKMYTYNQTVSYVWGFVLSASILLSVSLTFSWKTASMIAVILVYSRTVDVMERIRVICWVPNCTLPLQCPTFDQSAMGPMIKSNY